MIDMNLWTVSTSKLNKSILILCLIASILIDAVLFLQPTLIPIASPFKALIMVILVIYPVALLFRRSTYASLDILAVLSLLLLFFSYSIMSPFPSESIDRAIRQLFEVLIYLSFIYFVRFGTLNNRNLALLALICLSVLIPTNAFLSLNPTIDYRTQAAGAYTLLWVILFAALVRSPRDKLLSIAIILGCFALLLIMKRGAILCLGMALVHWLFLKNRHFPKFNTIASTLAIAILTVCLFTLFWFISGEQLSTRLADRTGSGRDLMYSTLLNGIISSSPIELIIGHGSMGVEALTGTVFGIREGARFGLQAHNDWLTLAYDFGLLGVSLFAIFHITIFQKIQRMKTSHLDLFVKLRPIHSAIFISSFFSEIFFNTSLTFAYVLLAIMSSPKSFAAIK